MAPARSSSVIPFLVKHVHHASEFRLDRPCILGARERRRRVDVGGDVAGFARLRPVGVSRVVAQRDVQAGIEMAA
jgi:hypothetical protein